LVRRLLRLGFAERIHAGQHIFTRDGMDEVINLQPKGGMATPYQAKRSARFSRGASSGWTAMTRYELAV
jgi:hypothetical protein